jgi:hypothetical protein
MHGILPDQSQALLNNQRHAMGNVFLPKHNRTFAAEVRDSVKPKYNQK